MKINWFPYLSSRVYNPVDRKQFFDMKVPVLTITTGKEVCVKGKEHNLYYRPYEFILRWPVIFQFQVHINRYEVAGFISEHIDIVQEGEKQYRIQFILENAKKGGELRCEHFIINWTWFKIFEPARFRHEVTKVEDGRRRLINIGVRIAPKTLRPYPF